MNSQKNWELRIDPCVFKTAKKLPAKEVKKIWEAVYLLPLNPYFGDIEKMKGYDDAWRRRIGSYRIFYRILVKEKIILIFNLERRASKTYI